MRRGRGPGDSGLGSRGVGERPGEEAREARAWAGYAQAWSERDRGARRGGEGMGRAARALAYAEASITLEQNTLPFLYAKK